MRIDTAAAPPFMKNGFVVSSETTREAVLIDPGDEVDELLDVIRRAAGFTSRRFCSRTHISIT